MTRMKLGCDVPYLADPGEIRAFAQAAEDLGYDHLGFSEHVASAPDSPFPEPAAGRPGPRFRFEDPWHESFTMLGYLAGVTARIELSTSMALIGLRPAVLVAKQAAEIDLLSDGRLRLGVAVGWNPREYEALGVDPRTRGDRIAEQVEVIRQLWSEPVVTYRGRHIQLDGVGISPRPRRTIPVWMGAGSAATGGRPPERAMRRIARLADGYKMMAPLGGDRGTALEMMRTLLRYTAEAGREPRQMGIEARLIPHVTPPDEWAAVARSWSDAGATHLSLANRAGPGGVQAQIAAITDAMQRIGPELAATRSGSDLEPSGHLSLAATAPGPGTDHPERSA
jgi:probable F420-dependent oxidoreductase